MVGFIKHVWEEIKNWIMFDEENLNFWNVELLVVIATAAIFLTFMYFTSKRHYKRKKFLTFYRLLFIGVFVICIELAFPRQLLEYKYEGWTNIWYSFFASVQNAASKFVMDGNVSDVLNFAEKFKAEGPLISDRTLKTYLVIASFMYAVAPLLTLGFVLSFFKNILSYVRYFFSFQKKRHIFSELNERSLALAVSIDRKDNRKSTLWEEKCLSELRDKNFDLSEKITKNSRDYANTVNEKKRLSEKDEILKKDEELKELKAQGDELEEKAKELARNIISTEEEIEKKKSKYRIRKRSAIIFTDILDKTDEDYLDLVERAKEIDAILFRKDINSVLFVWKKFGWISKPLRGGYSVILAVAGWVYRGLDYLWCKMHNKEYFDDREIYEEKKFSKKKASPDDKKINFNFYLMGEDESEKIRHASGLINEYKLRSDMKLYIFSDGEESKCLLNSYTEDEKNEIKMEVVRMNDIRFLVYHSLDENGIRLFEKANDIGNGQREISAVVVGLGRYGMEILKALLWYCQLPGYTVRINAFDENEDAAERFTSMCPDIKLGKTVNREGDMRYRVDIETVKIGTDEFDRRINKLARAKKHSPTYVFVALGTDAVNLTTSMEIRRDLINNGCNADIETVIYDSALKKRVSTSWIRGDIVRTGMEGYGIHVIGDMESFYSVKTVIASKLVKDGLDIHMSWANSKQDGFYMEDYNFYSSIAKALHRHLREKIIEYISNEKSDKAVFDKLLNEGIEEPRNWNRWLLEKTVDMDDAANVRRAVERFLRKKDSDSNDKERIELEKKLLGKLLFFTDAEDVDKAIKDIENCDKNKTEQSDDQTDKNTEPAENTENTEAKNKSENDKKTSESDGYSITEEAMREMLSYDNGGKKTKMSLQDILEMLRRATSLDHIRWVAYMRSEGYTLGPKRDNPIRKIYKTHHNIDVLDTMTIQNGINDI